MWQLKVRAGNLASWLRHLTSVRGFHANISQMLLMYRYHRTPFTTLLRNMLDVLSRYEARFTFAVVASIATGELLDLVRDGGHEIASHSLYHVKHRGLPFKTQMSYIKRSRELLQVKGAAVQGFRAPYNSYDLNTFRCLDELGFTYDAGVRRGEHFQGLSRPFHLIIDGAESRFLSYPVSHLSDELLDKLPGKTVLKLFTREIDEVPDDGVSVLQLHPVRVGQSFFLGFLDSLVDYSACRGFSMPTLTEVAEGKAELPAICLSGDVDCLSFSDYMRRI
ncbi:polysaccharide deacetylase family protein [Candidatus Bathyarchaeota archaeon]|nr:polysaccharide deacetylase family protein [Candidatus Bathyarchaeota archaeon]